MLSPETYEIMFDNDEWWLLVGRGNALMILDASLMDC